MNLQKKLVDLGTRSRWFCAWRRCWSSYFRRIRNGEKRSAKIYAEIIGFGMSDDAYRITAPAEDGKGAKLAMKTHLLTLKLIF